jgi:hypothetical protein
MVVVVVQVVVVVEVMAGYSILVEEVELAVVDTLRLL